MSKPTPQSKTSLHVLVDALDLPHKRHPGWRWIKKGPEPRHKPDFSRDRLVLYAGKLRALGMSDSEVAVLCTDLYWDSFQECRANSTFEALVQ